jgi:hypothetical protein
MPVSRGMTVFDAALYSNSTLALDANTGELKWYYQHVPGEVFDLDEVFERMLVDIDGQKLVFSIGKHGILWKLDRTNGKPVWPMEERPVPQSKVPGEHSAATQPFPSKPPAFDLLFWNADQTRMPKTLHMDYLRSMYGQNRLARGEFTIGGITVDLSKVTIPLYFQASREDHIAPMNSVYRSARAFSNAAVTLTLAGSGHIAGVVNPPSAHKYQHWTNPALPATLGEWQAKAVEHPGSWWNHWADWLHGKSGDWIPARDPNTGPLRPIEPAPGSYVKVKS